MRKIILILGSIISITSLLAALYLNNYQAAYANAVTIIIISAHWFGVL